MAEQHTNVDDITPSLIGVVTNFVYNNYLLMWILFVIISLYIVYYRYVFEFLARFSPKGTPVDITKNNHLRVIREQQQEKLTKDAIEVQLQSLKEKKEKKIRS